MATYSRSTDLKGPRFKNTSIPSPPPGTNTITPMLVLAMPTGSLQSTLANQPTVASSNVLQVVYNTPVDIGLNQLAGQYASYASASVSGVSLITNNTAATSGSAVTLTLLEPATTAVKAAGTLNVRTWKDLNNPELVTDVNQFLNRYCSRNASGNYNLVGGEGAYYALSEAKNKGAGALYVMVVASAASTGSLLANLNPTANATFQKRMLALTPQPDVICVPKMDYGVQLTPANWAQVDLAWKNYVVGRATDATQDPKLQQMLYITDAGDNADAAASLAYRTSTTNYSGLNSEYVTFVQGRYAVPSYTGDGSVAYVASSPAYLGRMNATANTAQGGYGHAQCGRRYFVIDTLGLAAQPSIAERTSLQNAGVNALVYEPSVGAFFENEYTNYSNSTTDGGNPLEHVSSVLIRCKVQNTIQPTLDSLRDEQNIALNRAGVKSRADAYLESLARQNIISPTYQFVDTTSENDELTGVVRFAGLVKNPRGIDYIELTFTSQFGS